MDNLWTDLFIDGRLMVSDFTCLHCEDSFATGVSGCDLKPGYVVTDIPNFCYGVKVVATAPEWVQLKVGNELITLVSGQDIKGPDKPLSYAYGEIYLRLKGEKIPALELYDDIKKCDKEERPKLFEKLISLSDTGDPWAASFAIIALVSPPYMYACYDSKQLQELANKLEATITQHPDFPDKDNFARRIDYLQRTIASISK